MKEIKKDTFIWEGLGFPIRLVNVPMKKVFGDWILDINLESVQKAVLHLLFQFFVLYTLPCQLFFPVHPYAHTNSKVT